MLNSISPNHEWLIAVQVGLTDKRLKNPVRGTGSTGRQIRYPHHIGAYADSIPVMNEISTAELPSLPSVLRKVT